SSRSSWLLRIRWVHPALSFVAGAFICWLVLRSLRRPAQRNLGLLLLLLLCAQYALGLADIALLTPTWLQMMHLLGADMLWITLVVLSARLCLVSQPNHPLLS